MEIVVTKQVEERLKVEFPCFLYSRKTGRYSKITAEGNLVKVGWHFLSVYNQDNSRLKDEINEVLADGELCTEKDFEHALKTQIKLIRNQS